MLERPTRAQALGRATRFKTLPVFLGPVFVGAALAGHRTGRFSWGLFGLTVLGAAAAQLGANVLNDHFDQRTGVDKLARIDRTAVPTASGALESGVISARALIALAVGLFGVAAIVAAGLTLARGATVAALASAGAALAVAYVAPPVRYGYRGHGLGEAGIFLAAGLIPLAGAYYVQAERLDGVVVWASIVPGLLTMLVVYQQNFLHWRPDRAVGKWTLVAWLEPERALLLDGILFIVAYVVLILQIAAGLFPLGAILGAFGAAPIALAWSQAFKDPMPQRYLGLLGAALGGAFVAMTSLAVALALA